MGIFALGDINDDGALDLDEFIAVMCPSALSVVSRLVGKYKNISEVKKAFLAIDVNKDGLLSKDELAGSGKFNAQDHCSTREEVLCLDRRIHPCLPLHLPADVDLQAGV